MIELKKDGSEIVHYDYEDYRAYVREALLSHYPNYAADSHWHDDVEFIYVRSGAMQYRVNDQSVTLNAGDGIFVNARQLHYGYSDTQAECEFLCVLLHPDLLCTSPQLTRQFIQPITQGSGPYLPLQKSVPWKAAILDALQTIGAHRDDAAAPLYIQQAFYRIWALLWENISQLSTRLQPDHRLAMVKAMVSLIQSRYTEKLTLTDIAASVSVSRNTCLNLFRAYLNDTPGQYLIAYRTKMAADLLLCTDRTISDIALSVGFSSPSHFAQTFKDIYGYTPKDYRSSFSKSLSIRSSAVTPPSAVYHTAGCAR